MEKNNLLDYETPSSSLDSSVEMGISEETLEEVHEALLSGENEVVEDLVADLHVADVADLIERLEDEDRQALIEVLGSDLNAEVFSHLEEKVLDEVVTQLGTENIAAAISDMDPDEAVNVLEELTEERQGEVIKALNAENRAAVEKVLSYPEKSAGRLMRSRMAYAKESWTVSQVLDFMSVSEDLPDEVFQIFIVDNDKKPLGVVSLSAIIKASRDERMSYFLDETELKTVQIFNEEEDVAELFKYYGLVSAPVVDDEGRLVGVITVDDVVVVIEEEAEKEILHIGGVGRSDFHTNIVETALARVKWLFVPIINSFLSMLVLQFFETIMKETIALAVLMPVAASMGSSAGMQVVTVIVRALATHEMKMQDFARPLIKEASVAGLIGLFLSLIFGGFTYFWFGKISLAFVMGASLIFNMLWAACGGVILPVVIFRLGFDPALSSGPLLASSADVLGYAIFLGLAAMFLG